MNYSCRIIVLVWKTGRVISIDAHSKSYALRLMVLDAGKHGGKREGGGKKGTKGKQKHDDAWVGETFDRVAL